MREPNPCRRMLEECSPGRIFELAQRDSMNAVLAEWKRGSISWEQALMFMVVSLADDKKRLLEQAVVHLERTAAPLIVGET